MVLSRCFWLQPCSMKSTASQSKQLPVLRRGSRPRAKILGRLDQTNPKHILPNAIHGDAARQGRLFVGQPAGKPQPIGLVARRAKDERPQGHVVQQHLKRLIPDASIQVDRSRRDFGTIRCFRCSTEVRACGILLPQCLDFLIDRRPLPSSPFRQARNRVACCLRRTRSPQGSRWPGRPRSRPAKLLVRRGGELKRQHPSMSLIRITIFSSQPAGKSSGVSNCTTATEGELRLPSPRSAFHCVLSEPSIK